jgi:hypothetical protein
MRGKKRIGPVYHGGRKMVWGNGAIAGDFVFLSGAEARDEDDDITVLASKVKPNLLSTG